MTAKEHQELSVKSRLSELSNLGKFIIESPHFRGDIDSKAVLAEYILSRCQELIDLQ